MKVSDLFEEASAAPIVKGTRALKFSLKTGENSLGVDLKNGKCEFFMAGYNLLFVGKPKALKVGEGYRFENAEKPGFMADMNSKLGDNGGYKVGSSTTDYAAALTFIKQRGDRIRIIVAPDLLKDAKPVETTAKTEPTEVEDGYFLLAYWGNPYGRGASDREYFWSGPYHDRKAALAFNKRRQEHGQPKTMKDWMQGSGTVIRGVDKFVAAAKKVDLNPNVKDLYWADE